MGGRKPLTRFVTEVDGQHRQLFKVRDRGSDIAIILTSAQSAHGGSLTGRTILEQRYSVHATDESPRQINEIKQTLRLEDEQLIETVCDTKGPKADLLQIIFARACPNLTPDRYDFETRQGDTVVSVGGFDPARRTLLYCVFVTSLTGPTRLAGSSRYEQKVFDFRHFRIIVVTTHVPLPAASQGVLHHAVSSMPRHNRADVGPKIVGPYSGADPKGARAMAFDVFQNLQKDVVRFPGDNLPQDILVVVNELGFGIWTEDELSKDIRRAARRVNAVFPKH